MNNEIKEILQAMAKIQFHGTNLALENKDTKILLDYITNLQEELEVHKLNEEAFKLEMEDITKILGLDEDTLFDDVKEYAENLREDNYAYHQLMRMQNKREYRSKFLKEFQEEYETNTFPDYDEIYKRYDQMKKRIEYLERSNNRKEDEIISLRDKCVTNEYELRLDQTINVFNCLSRLIKDNETCTYRYLIYDMLGFKPENYEELISGLTITNTLVDLQELKEQLKYNDLIFKALYKSFSDHEEYENYELLKELEKCYENKDIIWLQKFAGEDKQ